MAVAFIQWCNDFRVSLRSLTFSLHFWSLTCLLCPHPIPSQQHLQVDNATWNNLMAKHVFYVAIREEHYDLWKDSDLVRPCVQLLEGEKCLEQCIPQCLKSNDTHLLVTTAKHRSSKASLHFVGDVAGTLTSDDFHFICPHFVATVQEEVLSKQFRISCDNW